MMIWSNRNNMKIIPRSWLLKLIEHEIMNSEQIES